MADYLETQEPMYEILHALYNPVMNAIALNPLYADTIHTARTKFKMVWTRMVEVRNTVAPVLERAIESLH